MNRFEPVTTRRNVPTNLTEVSVDDTGDELFVCSGEELGGGGDATDAPPVEVGRRA